MKAQTISKLYYGEAAQENLQAPVKNDYAEIVLKNNVLSFENDVLKTDNSALRAEISKLKKLLKGVSK